MVLLVCLSCSHYVTKEKEEHEIKEAGGEDSDDSCVLNSKCFQPSEYYTIHDAVREQGRLITWTAY